MHDVAVSKYVHVLRHVDALWNQIRLTWLK